VGAIADPFGLVGTLLEGQFRVDATVGEGGFGVVYRGRHLGLDQPVAIKALKGLDTGDPNVNATILEKFRDEARLLYTLSQASLNVVRSLHSSAMTTPVGTWTPFMVLEWLEGRSLADDLADRRQRGLKGRTVEEALAILEPAAAGIAAAHDRNVAHRDIKPANVFLVNDASRVKVLDFGVAKIMKDGEEAGTKGTFVSFTWFYAAPEQLDPRYGRSGLATDVYAFALLVTELLTDRLPVEARDPVAILKAATDPTLRPTPRTRGAQNVPDAIEIACRRALAVDPAARFSSIKELWSALAARSSSPSIVTTTGAMPVTKTKTPREGAKAVTTMPTRARPSSTPRTSNPIHTPAPIPVPQGLSPPIGTPPPGAHMTGPFPQQPPRVAPPSGGAGLIIVTVILFVLAAVFAATWIFTGRHP
jgi:serine/threonine protein kinase